MLCFACGQDLPDAARFCSQCGINLLAIQARPPREAATISNEDKVEQETVYGSLPFEFDIIEHFRDKSVPEYKMHIAHRLGDAVDKVGLNYMDRWDISYPYVATNIHTIGDLAFYFKKINDRNHGLKPTTQMLMELLVRVYMKD